MSFKNNNNDSRFALWLKPILTGIISGTFIILVTLVLAALICSTGVLPLKAATIISSVAAALGAFSGGYFSAKKLKQNGLICGALCGLILFMIFTIISLIAFSETPTLSTLIRLVIFLTASAIGGILGVGSSSKAKII